MNDRLAFPTALMYSTRMGLLDLAAQIHRGSKRQRLVSRPGAERLLPRAGVRIAALVCAMGLLACTSVNEDLPPDIPWNYISVTESGRPYAIGSNRNYPNIYRVRVSGGGVGRPEDMARAIRSRFGCTRVSVISLEPNNSAGIFRGAFCRPPSFYR